MDPSVRQYIDYVLAAAMRLTLVDDEDPMEIEVSANDIPARIAALLLQACEIPTISASISNLPPQTYPRRKGVDPHPDMIPDDPDEYQFRRLDYIRQFLYVLAPMSMDVAAHVASMAEPAPLPTQRAVLILFSIWLPVAPHIKPIVSGLFASEAFQCPLDSEIDDMSSWLLSEASHRLGYFYVSQAREHEVFASWWDWNTLVHWTCSCRDDNIASQATKWHATRAHAFVLRVAPLFQQKFFRRLSVHKDLTAWQVHPWIIQFEEREFRRLAQQRQVRIPWLEQGVTFVDSATLRSCFPLHPSLVEIGPGIVFAKRKAVPPSVSQNLIVTETTNENLRRIGLALCEQKPILVSGPAGCGKTSLIREVAERMVSELLEVHIDDDTDTKSLIGSYTATEVPGEFDWRPGSLTRAVREGRWVLLEDIDTVSLDIQASLIHLLDDRLLPLGNGKFEPCHPDFRLFGTIVESRKRREIFSPTSWNRVEICVLPMQELRNIVTGLYSHFPEVVIESSLSIFSDLASWERSENGLSNQPLDRTPSIRDVFKLFSRIDQSVKFEHGASYIVEKKRLVCFAECIDLFVASISSRQVRSYISSQIIARRWNIEAQAALDFCTKRRPSLGFVDNTLQLGRLKTASVNNPTGKSEDQFSFTTYSLRLLESIGVCARQGEPTLLTGETGVGKTRILQELARLHGRNLLVQNMSLQTDASDLIGGFRPLQLTRVVNVVYKSFVDIFTATFSRKQNSDFLKFAASTLERSEWKKLSQCFQKAAQLGLSKTKDTKEKQKVWIEFDQRAKQFEQQRIASATSVAFSFQEGALVTAIRNGDWVLLDEINLASSETLQRLCGLLDSNNGSLILTERGDTHPVKRHPGFRIFGAMNPATDVGKKDLSDSIRSRFTEIYVDELLAPLDLRLVAGALLSSVLPVAAVNPEDSEITVDCVSLYLSAKNAESSLANGDGRTPHFSLRTFSRALRAAVSLVTGQKFKLRKALVEGFSLALIGQLDMSSAKKLRKMIFSIVGKDVTKDDLEHPGRRPSGSDDDFVLLKPFWIARGTLTPVEASNTSFVLTPTTVLNLRKICRAAASGKWPILLEGNTSSGKTSLVEYLAARSGNLVLRINNHEHTDIQEYLGGFTSTADGTLAFKDGLLVKALREGSWVILDELNLAPSDVLESLNRLLDDNREVFIPETNETIRAHPRFRLFATQNPSGVYGGRKPLSRAFRNRFVEMFVPDIPPQEMTVILEKKCSCPPSHAKLLVEVLTQLRLRRSKSGLFDGRDGLITPRDLLRWANRQASSKVKLGENGYMLLAERLRSDEEKVVIREVLENVLKITLDPEGMYIGDDKASRKVIRATEDASDSSTSVAPTSSFMRMVTLVLECVKRREPVLLVGDTGCGKTTVVQIIARFLKRDLHILNCHATTDISDIVGSLRPVRKRSRAAQAIISLLQDAFRSELLLGDRFPTETRAKIMSADTSNALDADTFEQAMVFAKSLVSRNEPDGKRQKVACTDVSQGVDSGDEMARIRSKLSFHVTNYFAPFEWVDGPLVEAMKTGKMILLDEMSLADDAVLERMNSVLEPQRTLVVAERGSCENLDDVVVSAVDGFHLFATMNPGGDFGKRELSPALRSRFTEIWVPPIHSSSDLSLIVGLCLQKIGEPKRNSIKDCILQYVQWFNNKCTEHMSSADLSLSVRDLVTWAQFVCTMESKIKPIEQLLLTGAQVMHLDGLGLGTGALTSDVNALKQSAREFILSFFQQRTCDGPKDYSGEVNIENSTFGFSSFRIRVGPHPIDSSRFDFSTEASRTNTMKVLRAMQVKRPVLLEGPPGVGKAMARSSGHKLTRINLSEQTDMSDLLGSDVPVSSDESTTAGNIFTWSDGPLLSAIKQGDWVLLDELNLASQSVLEGLNGCLDHRSTVVIPETGLSFVCPESFRLFAAQNSVQQGCGRKGLPKSFLNRFSKVYVDSLSVKDMEAIASGVFPKLSSETVKSVVSLTHEMEISVNDPSKGVEGGPWELNLRDILRACSSFVKDDTSSLQDVFALRFRSQQDYSNIERMFSTYFGSSSASTTHAWLAADSESLDVAGISLKRCSGWHDQACEGQLPPMQICESTPLPFRAVARAVLNKWPCLLVEASSQENFVRSLASSLNCKVIEVALSPSSEVSDLLGCFEQVDKQSTLSPLAVDLIRMSIATITLMAIPAEKLDRLSRFVSILQESLDSRTLEPEPILELLSLLQSLSLPYTEDLENITQNVTKLHLQKKSKALFQWKDGVLVHAMTKGYWLHLRNANLCPSSVLDRLNSVAEPSRTLLMAEGGQQGSDRKIKSHDDFRLFLSMDPQYGEVSRAMRNRCVEVYFDRKAHAKIEYSSLESLLPDSIVEVLITRGLFPEVELRVSEPRYCPISTTPPNFESTEEFGSVLRRTRLAQMYFESNRHAAYSDNTVMQHMGIEHHLNSLDVRDHLLYLAVRRCESTPFKKSFVGHSGVGASLVAMSQLLGNGKRVTERSVRLVVWLSDVEDTLSSKDLSSLSVLEVSCLVAKGKVDKSSVGCALTPLLFNFFDAYETFMSSIHQGATSMDHAQFAAHKCDMYCNGLRDVLNTTRFDPRSGNQRFSFPIQDFVTQWTWLQRQIASLSKMCEVEACKRELQALLNHSDLISSAVLPDDQFDAVIRSSRKWNSKSLLMKGIVGPATRFFLETARSLSFETVLDSRPLDTRRLLGTGSRLLLDSLDVKTVLVSALATQVVESLSLAKILPRSDVRIKTTLEKQIRKAEQAYIEQPVKMLIDHETGHFDGLIGSDELDQLKEQDTKCFLQVSEHVMASLARLQLAPLANTLCDRKESLVLTTIAEYLLSKGKSKTSLAFQTCLSEFVSGSIRHSSCNVAELWPAQFLLWLTDCKADSKTTGSLIGAVLPIISYFYLRRRLLYSSSSMLSHISGHLELPLYEDIENRVDSLGSSLQRDSVSGVCFSLLSSQYVDFSKTRFMTIENSRARVNQSLQLCDILSRVEESPALDHRAQVALALLVDTIVALKGSFSSENFEHLMCESKSFDTSDLGIFHLLLMSSSDKLFCHLLSTFGVKMLSALQHCVSGQGGKDEVNQSSNMAQCWVGLLRFCLLLPDSPIDPIQKARSKAKLLQTQHTMLSQKLKAHKLDSMINFGVTFSMETVEEVTQLLKTTERKQQNQSQKIVSRHCDSLEFSSLYESLHQFSRDFVQIERFSETIDALCSGVPTAMPVANQWLQSCKSIITTTESTYQGFDDVLIPQLGALCLMMDGISGMIATNERPELSTGATIEDCIVFPFSLSSYDSILPFNTKRIAINFDLALASLSRSLISSRSSGITADTVKRWRTFPSFIHSNDPYNEEDSIWLTHDDDTIDSVFPNYRNEFLDSDFPRGVGTGEDDVSVAPTLVSQLCALHRLQFLEGDAICDDERISTFRLAYRVGLRLNDMSNELIVSDAAVSGHVFALKSLIHEEMQLQYHRPPFLTNERTGFSKQPNSVECFMAYETLSDLRGRLIQLLQVFVGNTVLLTALRLVEKVCKLDIHQTPFGKVMSGCELVLRHAQDWEEHASERVKLGAPLSKLHSKAIHWRQLELASWASLLDAREKEQAQRASQNWGMLNALFQQALGGALDVGNRDTDIYLPGWISNKQLTEFIYSADLDRIFKLFDTFMLTSSIGQYKARLQMLHTFAKHAQFESHLNRGRTKLQVVTQFLGSLGAYYEQFLAPLTNELKKKRAPIDEKLKKDVRLARWDQQTHHARMESTEKNHRSLMMHVQEYDAVLQANIMPFIENIQHQGVGSSTQSTSGIPTISDTFPWSMETAIRTRPAQYAKTSPLPPSTIPVVRKISALVARLESFQETRNSFVYNQAQFVAKECNTMCDAIFGRIESLQSGGTTRPMKERALHDLFRALEEQGVTNSSWKVPPEIASMRELLCLPLNEHTGRDYLFPILSEHVCFQKALSCSRHSHISHKQSELMRGFHDNLLVMVLQQRCTLARLGETIDMLRSVLDYIDNGKRNPVPCSKACVGAYLMHYNLLLENVHQLILLLQVCIASKKETGENLHGAIHDLSQRLAEAPPLTSEKIPVSVFITDSVIEEVKMSKRFIQGLLMQVKKVQATIPLSSKIPLSSFATCISLMQKAIADAEVLVNQSKGPLQVNPQEAKTIAKYAEDSVQTTLVSIQAIHQVKNDESTSTTLKSAHTILQSACSKASSGNSIQKLTLLLTSFENCGNDESWHSSLQILRVVACLYQKALHSLDGLREEMLVVHGSFTKLHYVILRVFRVLLNRGFCSDSIDEAEGDMGPLDQTAEGTGMGEGEGKTDVTDQLENEEQILGLQDQDMEENNETQGDDEKGMEMENTFDGQLCDVPEADESAADDKEETDIDRELGDEDLDGEVLDSKMWDGDSDDDDDDGDGRDDSFEPETVLPETSNSDEVTSGEKANNRDSEVIDVDENDNESDKREDDNPEEVQHESTEETAVDEKTEGVVENETSNQVDENECDESPSQGGEEEQEVKSDCQGGDSQDEEGAEEDQDEPEEQQEDDEDQVGTTEPMDEDTPDNEEGGSNGPHVDPVDISDDTPEENGGKDTKTTSSPQLGLGVTDKEGMDTIDQMSVEFESDLDNDDEGEAKANRESGKPGASGTNASSTADELGGEGQGEATEQATDGVNSAIERIPNPFKNPGDASEFWHNRLNVIESHDNSTEESSSALQEDGSKTASQYEYVSENQRGTTQTMAEASTENDQHMAIPENQDTIEDQPSREESSKEEFEKERTASTRQQRSSALSNHDETPEINEDTDKKTAETDLDDNATVQSETKSESCESLVVDSHAKTDLNQISLKSRKSDARPAIVEDHEDVGQQATDEKEMRAKWSQVQGETLALSRRLCEKLRLVMEPLVASKLRGDYRTGKRINMKRVISYIASGYRRDKIWLRRTKPSKRNYRVLVAVDDSESMLKTGAGEMALRAMSVLATGMSQLEIGQVGVASFGDEMRLLHPFDTPFTFDNGVSLVNSFTFKQERTRTALCVESAMMALDTPGDVAPTQVVFMISDGRIERDSRDDLRRLIRQMMEKNILLALIIVEGKNKKDSILNMKEVSFEKGKPKIKHFIDEYPFPYYIFLDDMNALPEVLGDALRQWFEMLSRLEISK